MMVTTPHRKKKSRLTDLHLVLGDVLLDQTPHLSQNEWGVVAANASEHGVSGFLYKQVRDKSTENEIPSDVLARLRQDYVSNQALYFRYLSQVLPIFEQLNEEGIPFYIYKGCALIERYYRDPGLRPISDFDVVMKAKDILAASQIIEKHGFLKEHTFGHHFYRQDVCLDVHEDLFRLDRVPSRKYAIVDDGAGLWDRLDILNIQGCSVATLAPYEEFIFLSWHAMKHSFSHLKWLVDLGMMYRILSRSSDFSNYLSGLPDDSVRKSVWYVLRLLHEWFGIPIEQGLQKNVQPGKLGWMEQQAFNLVRRGAMMTSFAEVSFLGSMEGLTPKLQFLREMLLGEGLDLRRMARAAWSPIKSVSS